MRIRIGGRTRARAIRKMTGAAVVVVLAGTLAACVNDGSAGSQNGGPGSTEVDADPEAVAEVARELFLTDVPTDELDPALLRTLEIASLEWTDEMQDKLMECLGTDVCETGNDGYVVAFPNDNINPWRQTFRAELTAQAIQSGRVSKIIYSLGADVPTWLANFKSLVAQRPDIIVIDSIYGPAILPALQQAKDAGITVVNVETPLPDEVASLVDAQATSNLCSFYEAAAADAVELAGEGGTYGLYTGVPGNGSAAVWQPCATEALEDAGWSQAIEGFTQWTPQGMTQEATAMYASGENPTAVLYDYTMEYFAEPYLEEGETPPIMISDVVNSAYLGQSRDATEDGVDVQGLIANGRSWFGRIGVTTGLMIKDGDEVNQQIDVPYPSASLADVVTNFDPAMPANAPVPTLFDAEQMAAILAEGS